MPVCRLHLHQHRHVSPARVATCMCGHFLPPLSCRHHLNDTIIRSAGVSASSLCTECTPFDCRCSHPHTFVFALTCSVFRTWLPPPPRPSACLGFTHTHRMSSSNLRRHERTTHVARTLAGLASSQASGGGLGAAIQSGNRTTARHSAPAPPSSSLSRQDAAPTVTVVGIMPPSALFAGVSGGSFRIGVGGGVGGGVGEHSSTGLATTVLTPAAAVRSGSDVSAAACATHMPVPPLFHAAVGVKPEPLGSGAAAGWGVAGEGARVVGAPVPSHAVYLESLPLPAPVLTPFHPSIASESGVGCRSSLGGVTGRGLDDPMVSMLARVSPIQSLPIQSLPAAAAGSGIGIGVGGVGGVSGGFDAVGGVAVGSASLLGAPPVALGGVAPVGVPKARGKRARLGSSTFVDGRGASSTETAAAQ